MGHQDVGSPQVTVDIIQLFNECHTALQSADQVQVSSPRPDIWIPLPCAYAQPLPSLLTWAAMSKGFDGQTDAFGSLEKNLGLWTEASC